MSTAVFVCADSPDILLDGVEVNAIEGLCETPLRIAEQLGGADRVVLLLHESHYDLADVQKALRSVEVDPLGSQILDVPLGISESDLEATLAGLRQRALAYAGSRPEHQKPTIPHVFNRRSLFRAPRPWYRAAPMVDEAKCAAVDGCQACVEPCPQGAYRWQQGRIHFNRDLCEPCGMCVSACPTEAISIPSTTPKMLAAQVGALVGHGDAPVGLRFVCRGARSAESVPGWHEIVVPCTGMVPGTWLLTALLMGAGSVTAASCADADCQRGLDEHSRTAVDLARSVLTAADLDPNLVPLQMGDVIREPIARTDFTAPFTHAGDAEAMLVLDSISPKGLDVTHTGSSLGVVTIDPESCTLCAQCAQTCPTTAIQAGFEEDTVTLSFNAAACTNCGQCTIACPEVERGAIRVAARIDSDLLRSGRRTINEGVVLVCESCGKPVAPEPMMDRIGELLGEEFEDTMQFLTRRCMDCRGLT